MSLLLRISFIADSNGMTLVKWVRVEVTASTLLIYHETPHKKPPSNVVFRRFLAFFRFVQRNSHWQRTLEFQRNPAIAKAPEVAFQGPEMELIVITEVL